MDHALFSWLELVCGHNIPPSKTRNKEFAKHLNVDPVSYNTLVETMLHLTLLVEEKIAKEMKGLKGTILHDGWSRYVVKSTSYLFCLTYYHTY